MINTILMLYVLFSILYFMFLIRILADCHSVISESKSRDMKNLAKNKIASIRRDIVLCPAWPYLLYRDVSTARKALQSLK